MDAPEAMHSTEADHVTVLGRRLLLKDGRLDNVKLAKEATAVQLEALDGE